MKSRLLLLLPIILLASCNNEKTKSDKKGTSNPVEEIRKAEADFMAMTKSKGIAEAFAFYADEDAVIKRENDTLIKGPAGIQNYYSPPHYKTAVVTWSPDFVEASDDGTMAHSYGNYKWKFVENTGKSTEHKGVYHTVWKKQKDGSWKYIWD